MKFDISTFSKENIKKSLNFLKYNGVDGVMSQVRYKMTGPGLAYNNWYKEKHEADSEELLKQRENHLSYEPLISVVVSIYKTPEYYLRSMIESVIRQSYENWQLCIIDGSIMKDERHAEEKHFLNTENIVREYMEKDGRIRYLLMEEDLGIAESLNAGIDMSAGSYVAFIDHDDILTDDALYCVVKALQDERYELLYSDEDKMSEDGSKYSDPAFKPDFSLDLIRSYNYMHSLMVVSKRLALSIGNFNTEFDGAQYYDFVLRCVEKTDSIKHIPRVLYHYRINNLTTELEHKKEYNQEMAKRALAAHIRRTNLYATLGVTEIPGINKVNYETPGNPYISIIIPGCDNIEVIDRLLKPLFELARYSNFEIIIIDREGSDQMLLKYYQRMESIRKNISVIVNRSAENMSAIRNFGALRSKGEYLLFLDSNIEIISPGAIGEMLGICMRPEVGAVSGTLYTSNNTVYNQGYVVGVNGYFDNLYRGLRKGAFGYLMQNRTNRDLSAIPSSCMMVKKSVFVEAGGFFEAFEDELAAVDLCLRIRELNKLIVCACDATWCYHTDYKYELRELIKPEAKIEEEPTSEQLFEAKWQEILEEGDPYYNKNFAKDGELFSLE